MAAKSNTIEESFEQIEDILARLDDGSLSLEESFKLYEIGMKLIKSCNSKIEKVEEKIRIVEANSVKNCADMEEKAGNEQ